MLRGGPVRCREGDHSLGVSSKLVDADFTDQEIDDLDRVARYEFGLEPDEGWIVAEVRRSSDQPGRAELVIESTATHRQKVVFVNRAEFAEENPANESRLSDVGFNFSIRLLEFHHIRGFDVYDDDDVVTLELYPPDR